MVGGDDNQDGAGGPASAFGSSKSGFAKPPALRPQRIIKAVSNPFRNDSAGKLSRSGAGTRSESLARLRGKGALS